ncbi:ABC transporter permease [Caproicibacter fermentans]|uniref:ABC transporter permease subunit n=1 Tax=Caproicibacter fermentans TaxID=2576756 RepID=A0A7G8TBQ6_9FIRM|nr:ABC transporter permease subunit [Caproicibacter fermentans]QNK41047.1 ABC transporter permease subunit [Caproicibacter fermentans]
MISIIKSKKILRRFFVGCISITFWICVWQWVYWAVGEEILVVSPLEVLNRLGVLLRHWSFWMTVILSMFRILEGFLLGIFLGTGFAILTEVSRVGSALLRPVIGIMKATPVASFIILALVWMKSSQVPVFASVLIVLPILWANVSEGIRKTDRSLLQMAEMYRFGRVGTVKKVYLPSVLPYFTAACTTGMGMAWKGGVAAEVLSSLPLSLGGEIYRSKIYLETTDLFAWTAVVILLSVLLERAMLCAVKAAGVRFGFYSGEGYDEH